MPQICTVCRHPQRLQIERALLNRDTYRNIAKQFETSTAALVRHRDHIAGAIEEHTSARETARTRTLLQDVRAGEGRAERLYQHAERILARALEDNDRRSALQSIKVAIGVMAEARNLMEVRGELTGELDRDRTGLTMSVQIICPGIESAESAPRVSFSSRDAIDAADSRIEEIGLLQPPQ